MVSFSLYAKVGFEPKEQMNFFMGRCAEDWPDQKLNLTIRPMTPEDLPECAALHKYQQQLYPLSLSLAIALVCVRVCVRAGEKESYVCVNHVLCVLCVLCMSE